MSKGSHFNSAGRVIGYHSQRVQFPVAYKWSMVVTTCDPNIAKVEAGESGIQS